MIEPTYTHARAPEYARAGGPWDVDTLDVALAASTHPSHEGRIAALAGGLRTAHRDGHVRAGDPRQLAAMVLLIAQSTIQSAQMIRPILRADALATELTHALNGYLS